MRQELILPPGSKPAIPSDDKTQIIMALREVARGMEQGHPDILSLMQILGTELLVFALKYGEAQERIGPEETERLVRQEIAAIADNIAKLHENRITEAGILNDRLTRLFDPTLAFNEAIFTLQAVMEMKGSVHELIAEVRRLSADMKSTSEKVDALRIRFAWVTGATAVVGFIAAGIFALLRFVPASWFGH